MRSLGADEATAGASARSLLSAGAQSQDDETRVTYHPPAVVPLRREAFVIGALDGAEVFTAPVVVPTLTVWIQMVQDAHGRLHRSLMRAELAGGLNTGSPEVRRRWADTLTHHGARAMATLLDGGSPFRWLCHQPFLRSHQVMVPSPV